MKQLTVPQSLPPAGSRQDASDSSPSLVLYCPFYIARVFPVNPVPAHAILDQCLSPATKELQVDGRYLWPEARPLHPSPLPGTQQAPALMHASLRRGQLQLGQRPSQRPSTPSPPVREHLQDTPGQSPGGQQSHLS